MNSSKTTFKISKKKSYIKKMLSKFTSNYRETSLKLKKRGTRNFIKTYQNSAFKNIYSIQKILSSLNIFEFSKIENKVKFEIQNKEIKRRCWQKDAFLNKIMKNFLKFFILTFFTRYKKSIHRSLNDFFVVKLKSRRTLFNQKVSDIISNVENSDMNSFKNKDNIPLDTTLEKIYRKEYLNAEFHQLFLNEWGDRKGRLYRDIVKEESINIVTYFKK